jgi:hypothetical protein
VAPVVLIAARSRRLKPALYCNRAVLLRFGTWPTGIRAVSFIVATSIADVQFEPDIAT